jgi:hypothetical protein
LEKVVVEDAAIRLLLRACVWIPLACVHAINAMHGRHRGGAAAVTLVIVSRVRWSLAFRADR